MLVLALAAAAGVSAAVAWFVDQRRCRRRNERGECAACSVAWGEIRSSGPYLIHGRLVCETCADKAKRRLLWQFGILAAGVAVATGFTVAERGVAAIVLFPAASTIIMSVGAVQLMKRANRDAQRRIAAGELLKHSALATEASSESERTLPEGPAA